MSPTEPLDQIDSDPQLPRLQRGLLVAGAAVLAVAATALTAAALADAGGGGTNDETTLAAASGSASPSASANAKEKRDKAKAKIRQWRLGRRGQLPLAGGALGALHGEFVVPDGSGGYRTVVTQHGTASEVGDSSIAVKSEDGFSQTYDVPAAAVVGAQRDGLASIDKGDEVMVVAEKKGATLRADVVADLDTLRNRGPAGFGPGGMGGPGLGWRGHGAGDRPDGGTDGSTETPTTGASAAA